MAQYALSPLPRVPSACQIGLAQLAQFKPLPPIAAAGECAAADVVLLQGVILLDKTKVAVVPPATLRCTMAEAGRTVGPRGRRAGRESH